jgi:peptidoglycan/LPS O-acetylase OafA/YrhL
MIGKHWFNEFSRKSQLKSQIRGAIIVAGFAVLCFFRDMGLLPNPVYEIVTNSVVKNLLLLVAAMGLWNMADLFMDRVQLRHYHSTSFGVFAMHINVSAVVTKLAYFALPKSGIFAVVNFGITVLVTLALIDVFYIVLEKGSPKLLRLLTGGRNA